MKTLFALLAIKEIREQYEIYVILGFFAVLVISLLYFLWAAPFWAIVGFFIFSALNGRK